MALDFGNKVENGGIPPNGVLPASEFNALVAQVNKNEEDIAEMGGSDMDSPTPADGTIIVTLPNGDTITLDLNHAHPQYLKYELVSSLPASPDSGTLYLIAAT